MFKNEVDYRIARVLLTNIRHFGVLDKDETEVVCKKLLEYYNPEFKSVEDINYIKADGDIVGVREKSLKHKRNEDDV